MKREKTAGQQESQREIRELVFQRPENSKTHNAADTQYATHVHTHILCHCFQVTYIVYKQTQTLAVNKAKQVLYSFTAHYLWCSAAASVSIYHPNTCLSLELQYMHIAQTHITTLLSCSFPC
ncbi:hypothetical protein PDJAM_G00223510 [Pangasius djambal]|uniref:Uncharacterized protein n=1 Tax=Pangasius djambal TaxID=1691987 RepID=A0ACC5YCQ3_9TELE|nr:hypothetical protein [Pangasius djambal]